MTLFKHTEPPKEKGIYLCEIPYDGTEVMTKVLARWMGAGWDVPLVKCHYSPSPPKEIEDAIGFIDIALKVDNETPVILPIEIAKTLLKLRAE